MWKELNGVRERWDVAWCNAGEFKVIRYLSERIRFNQFSFEMFDFSDIVGEFNMIDMPLEEGYVHIIGGW